MGKGRFEAFSDGVIAIIITIMVLEFRVPEGGAVTHDAQARGQAEPISVSGQPARVPAWRHHAVGTRPAARAARSGVS